MKAHMTLAMVGTLVLAAAPIASHAGSNKAINACVKSFVANYVPKDRVIRVHRYVPAPGPLSLLLDRKGTYTVALAARGKTSGKEIAQARCVANGRGDVIVLDSPPVDTYVADADFAAVVTR